MVPGEPVILAPSNLYELTEREVLVSSLQLHFYRHLVLNSGKLIDALLDNVSL
jgi:hypothetical protein